jgi:hypothetical protein
MSRTKIEQRLSDLVVENKRLRQQIQGTELAQDNRRLKQQVQQMQQMLVQLQEQAATNNTGKTGRRVKVTRSKET